MTVSQTKTPAWYCFQEKDLDIYRKLNQDSQARDLEVRGSNSGPGLNLIHPLIFQDMNKIRH